MTPRIPSLTPPSPNSSERPLHQAEQTTASYEGHEEAARSTDARDKPLSFQWASRRHEDELVEALRADDMRRDAQVALVSIVLDLYMEAMGAGRPTSYSRRRTFYAEPRRYRHMGYTYDSVVRSGDFLAEAGWIENRIAAGDGPSGIQSTMLARSELRELVAQITGDEIVPRPDREPIWLRDASGDLLDYRDNREISRMRQKLERMNEAIAGITIGIPGTQRLGQVTCFGERVIDFRQKYLRRIFNGDMRHGGRFYDRGAWQNVPKKDRAGITICGEATVELDYAQLHPKVVYSRAAQPLEGDAHSLPGWSRPVAKAAFNILLNARTHQAALGAIAESDPMIDAFPAMDGPGRRERSTALIRDLRSRHAHVAGFFHTGVGLELQRVDSDMAEGVQISLLGKGIVCLPIHDSFIVAAKHVDHLREAMVKAAAGAGIVGGEENLVRAVA